MKGFSGWLYERRASRIVLMAGLFPLGLLSIISAAIAVFTAEVKHWREALIDVAGALAILTVVTLMLRDSVLPEVFGAALVWLAATGLGVLTGVYGSMTLAVQVLLMVVVAGIVIFAAAVSDPVGYWEGFIQDFSQQMAEIGVQVAPLDLLLPLTPLMNGAVGAGMVVSSVLALLLGTWWASRAGGPALRPLFTSLRLGIVVGGITLIVGLLSILDVYAEAVREEYRFYSYGDCMLIV